MRAWMHARMRARMAAAFARAAAFACAAACALASAASCGGEASDRGLDAALAVHGATFYRGAMPSGDGPAVASAALALGRLRAGQQDAPLHGALAPGATAAAIGFAGDRGYWIVTASGPDPAEPGYPSFDAPLSLAPTLAPGDYDLVVRAVDGAGRFGAASTQTLSVTAAPIPTGTLVVSLFWDTESDLDLHLVVPGGVEVFNRNVNSWQPPPPGQPIDPSAYKTGGLLDFDSNAACVIDGRRLEDVVWTAPPPSGHYVVRVDTASLCGEIDAHWTVEVRLADAVVARARGTSLETDTQYAHDRGAGVLALEFDVP